jgi:hypothetical protein
MIAGVGIIGALASLLSNLLIGRISSPLEDEATQTVHASTVEQELMRINAKLDEMHQLLEKISREGNKE